MSFSNMEYLGGGGGGGSCHSSSNSNSNSILTLIRDELMTILYGVASTKRIINNDEVESIVDQALRESHFCESVYDAINGNDSNTTVFLGSGERMATAYHQFSRRRARQAGVAHEIVRKIIFERIDELNLQSASSSPAPSSDCGETPQPQQQQKQQHIVESQQRLQEIVTLRMQSDFECSEISRSELSNSARSKSEPKEMLTTQTSELQKLLKQERTLFKKKKSNEDEIGTIKMETLIATRETILFMLNAKETAKMIEDKFEQQTEYELNATTAQQQQLQIEQQQPSGHKIMIDIGTTMGKNIKVRSLSELPKIAEIYTQTEEIIMNSHGRQYTETGSRTDKTRSIPLKYAKRKPDPLHIRKIMPNMTPLQLELLSKDYFAVLLEEITYLLKSAHNLSRKTRADATLTHRDVDEARRKIVQLEVVQNMLIIRKLRFFIHVLRALEYNIELMKSIVAVGEEALFKRRHRRRVERQMTPQRKPSKTDIHKPATTATATTTTTANDTEVATKLIINQQTAIERPKLEHKIRAKIERKIINKLENKREEPQIDMVTKIEQRRKIKRECKLERKLEAEAELEAKLEAKIEARLRAEIEAKLKPKLEARLKARIEKKYRTKYENYSKKFNEKGEQKSQNQKQQIKQPTKISAHLSMSTAKNLKTIGKSSKYIPEEQLLALRYRKPSRKFTRKTGSSTTKTKRYGKEYRGSSKKAKIVPSILPDRNNWKKQRRAQRERNATLGTTENNRNGSSLARKLNKRTGNTATGIPMGMGIPATTTTNVNGNITTPVGGIDGFDNMDFKVPNGRSTINKRNIHDKEINEYEVIYAHPGDYNYNIDYRSRYMNKLPTPPTDPNRWKLLKWNCSNNLNYVPSIDQHYDMMSMHSKRFQRTEGGQQQQQYMEQQQYYQHHHNQRQQQQEYHQQHQYQNQYQPTIDMEDEQEQFQHQQQHQQEQQQQHPHDCHQRHRQHGLHVTFALPKNEFIKQRKRFADALAKYPVWK